MHFERSAILNTLSATLSPDAGIANTFILRALNNGKFFAIPSPRKLTVSTRY